MVLSHERPFPRPAIPLLLQCGVVFWLGCLLSWLLDYDVALSAGLSLVSLAFLFATYRISYNGRSGFRLLLAWALFFFLGATLMSVSINGLHHKREVLAGSDGAIFAVRILEDPTRGSFGYSVPALIVEPNSDFIRKQLYSYKVMLNYESGSFEYCDEFLAKVDISSIDEHYLDYFDKKGIVARCSVSDLRPVHSSQFGQLSELRLNFASSVSECLDFDTVNHDAVALIKALVVGNRQELFESDFYNQVKTVGLAHLVAVSGAHLVIVMGLISSCMRAIRLPRYLSVIIQLGFLFAYLIMVGLPVSCVRAAVMAARIAFICIA